MAYSAKPTQYGTYEIFQDGNRISTGSASILGNYGLSADNLAGTSAKSEPTYSVAQPTGQSIAYGAVNVPKVAPTLTPEVYGQYSTKVLSGELTPDQAQSQLQRMISSGEYSGSVDAGQLFKSGQTYARPTGEVVQFDNTGTGRTITAARPAQQTVISGAGTKAVPTAYKAGDLTTFINGAPGGPAIEDSTLNALAQSFGITGYQNNPTYNAQLLAKLQAAKTAADAAKGVVSSGATAPSAISNPVSAPSTGTTGAPAPTLPTPTAANTADIFNTSLTAQLASQKAAYEAEATKRAADYQVKIDALNKQEAELQTLQDNGMSTAGQLTAQQAGEKRAQFELEKQRVDENYNANQALVNEMDGLLTTGNQVIAQMKQTTGLASIMNPRIAQTMTDVAARAGVIQAVLSARNNQIGIAQNQLKTAVDTISSIYGDQINYYKTLVDYYGNLKDETGKKLITLTKDQEKFLDAKISVLESEYKNTQNTANIISKAMLDPDTAQAYAQAGVSLNDTPAQIGAKLATYSYAKEIKDTSNAMAKEGYSTSPIAGGVKITTTDSKGTQKTWYKAASASSNPGAQPLSILDVQRYNEAFPNAGVTAGDTQATADAKVNRANSPEVVVSEKIKGFKDSGVPYEEVIINIKSSDTIQDKESALKDAQVIYGVSNDPLAKFSGQEISKPSGTSTPANEFQKNGFIAGLQDLLFGK